MEIAKEEGTYKTYEGSPVSKGIFQFDMWGIAQAQKDGIGQNLREKLKNME